MVLADSLIITAKKIKQLSMKYNKVIPGAHY